MKRKTRKIIEKQLRQYYSTECSVEWGRIINNRIHQLSDSEKEVVKLRYKDKKNINYITYELYMSRCKYFSTIDNILTEIALDAAYYHLIKR